MKVAVIFDPDAELGPDPLDTTAQLDRSLGEWMDGDKDDVLVLWRRFSPSFEGGSRTNIFGTGSWEYLTHVQVEDIIARLGDLE